MGANESSRLDILFEDNHCIAVVKPAGVPCAHFDGTIETLDRKVKAHLKAKFGKPGEVFLGIVHRLDRPTTGVVLFARTSKAAARLSEQFRKQSIEKVYWAVVPAGLTPAEGLMEDWLVKDETSPIVRIASANNADARKARTAFQVRQTVGGFSWIELRPQTGRKHQLRVQLASRGFPIVGDQRYGSKLAFPLGIALHARSLRFVHPVQKLPIHLTAPLPPCWGRQFSQLQFAERV